MRVAYIAPGVKEFDTILKKPVRGGSIQTFNSPIYYQRGGGIFSFLGNMVRRSLPILRRIFLPAAADFGRDVAYDYSSGMSPKAAVRKRAPELMGKMVSRVTGGGRIAKTTKAPCGRKRRRSRMPPIFK